MAPGRRAGVGGVQRGEHYEGAVPTESRPEGERPHQAALQDEVIKVTV